jgi:hypothetical protein
MDLKEGDIVSIWGNRKTSNGMDVTKLVSAKVVGRPMKASRWDTKTCVAVEVLEGHVQRASGQYISRSSYNVDGKSFSMNSNYGARSKGNLVIIYSDACKVESSVEASNNSDTTDEANHTPVEMSDTLKSINQDTLMCLMSK